jgi:hypothetical protein
MSTEYKNNEKKSKSSAPVKNDEREAEDDEGSSSDEDSDKVALPREQYHIIESIEDLRHIRADLFTIMSTKGDDGHQECSDIIEKAIQVKVKIIQRNKKRGDSPSNSNLNDYYRKLAEQCKYHHKNLPLYKKETKIHFVFDNMKLYNVLTRKKKYIYIFYFTMDIFVLYLFLLSIV